MVLESEKVGELVGEGPWYSGLHVDAVRYRVVLDKMEGWRGQVMADVGHAYSWHRGGQYGYRLEWSAKELALRDGHLGETVGTFSKREGSNGTTGKVGSRHWVQDEWET